MRSCFTLLIALVFPTLMIAQEALGVHKAWEKTFGGAEDDHAYAIAATGDGGCVVGGETRSMGHGKTDMSIIKMDQNGTILWNKSTGKGGKESVKGVVETSDGMLVATGESTSYAENGNLDIVCVKLNQQGEIVWQKSYGGKGKEYANAIAKTADGGVVIAGGTKSFGEGSYDFYLLRLNSKGEIVWEKTYGGEDLEMAYGIEATTDGGFIVVGLTNSYGAGNSDFYIVKIDKDGKTEWTQTYGEKKEDVMYAVKETADGYVIAGETRSYESQKRDLSVMKLDKSGKILFHKLFGLKNHDFARGVALTDKGNFLVAGATNSMGNGKSDFYTLELDAHDGALVWANVYGGKKNDLAYGIAKVKDGGFVVGGESESFGEGGFDVYVLKLGL